MSSRTRVMTIALAGVLALASTSLIAQAPYLLVHFDQISPEGSHAFEANAKDWGKAFSEAGLGSEHSWDAYSSDFTYAWVLEMPDWAYMNGNAARQAAIAEAVGKETMAALIAGGSAAVSHYNEIWKFEPSLSYFADDFSPDGMTAINVGIHYVKPTMEEDYKSVVKDVVAALAKIGAPMHFFGHSIAAGQGSYAYVSYGENRAALHSGPEIGALLAQAEGPEGAQTLFERWTACITNVEERDWQVRPDLSYSPSAEPEAADEASPEGGEEGDE